MNKAYLLIGGNLGDRHQKLDQAISCLGTLGDISRQSGRYETAAWGRTDQPSFLNQVLLLTTKLSAPDLLKAILQVEEQMGRIRMIKYGPRTIDIDILLYNDAVISEPDLAIPHPEMQNRRFVLQPLAAIAPQLQHPVLHKSIQQLLEECPDTLDVQQVEP